MPRLLLALLMTALLCLRVGLGDAMALGMLAQHNGSASVQHAAMAQASAPHQQQQEAMPCHGAADDAGAETLHSMHQSAPAQQDGDAHQQHGCETCGACQVCHGSAIALGSVPALSQAAPPAAPRVQDVHFASADPVLRHKPPIS